MDQALGRAPLGPTRPLGAAPSLPSAHTLVPSPQGISRGLGSPESPPQSSPPPRCPKCILLLPARPLGSVGTTRAISFPLPAPSSPLQAAPGSRRGHGAQASPQQTWSRRWGAFLLETPASPHLHHMVLLLSAAPLLSPSGSSFYAHLSPGAPRVGKEPICLP